MNDDTEQDSLNEADIPLLEDRVDTEEGLSPDHGEIETPPLIDEQKLREQISADLLSELPSLVSIAIEKAVSEATQQIDQILRDELTGTLDQRLRTLIQLAIQEDQSTPVPEKETGKEEEDQDGDA
jgi:hypothetical protein